MEQLWAGTCKASGSYTTGDSVIAFAGSETQLYTVGMYIFIGDDTNNGAGYLITAVHHAQKKLTISPQTQGNPGEGGAAPTISPWWPTGGSEVGLPVHGKMGMVTVGGENCVVLSARVTVVNNIKYYINEKNNEWTAERFGRPKMREIDGELELFFLKPC